MTAIESTMGVINGNVSEVGLSKEVGTSGLILVD